MGKRPERDESRNLYCSDCNAELDRRTFNSPDDVVVHCAGGTGYGSQRQGAHHGRRVRANCWKCDAYVGCDQCQPILTEVLCERCGCWTEPEAFVAHGPVMNDKDQVQKRGFTVPQWRSYPETFQAAYLEYWEKPPPANCTQGVGDIFRHALQRVQELSELARGIRRKPNELRPSADAAPSRP